MMPADIIERDSTEASMKHHLGNSMYVFEGRTGWDGYVWFVPANTSNGANNTLAEALGLSRLAFNDLLIKPDGIRRIGKGFVLVNLEIQSEFIKTYPNGVVELGWSE